MIAFRKIDGFEFYYTHYAIGCSGYVYFLLPFMQNYYYTSVRMFILDNRL